MERITPPGAGPDEVELASSSSFPASDPPPWTLGSDPMAYRMEHDSMGEVRVPYEALYGAQTQRAVENFPISKNRLQAGFIRALGLIKGCAARINGEMGVLPLEVAHRIEQAADDVALGRYHDQFVVDVFQTGSGTSTNMNANEVIGRLADAHPNDEVNRSQSSNDVFPAAMHVATVMNLQRLLPQMEELALAIDAKAKEFWDVFKIGRTHLQDATPLRLGEEFSGYAHQVKASAERIKATMEGLYELPLGGTAVGTGVNAPRDFGKRICLLLSQRTGLPFREARNHFEAQAARDAVLFASGALRTYAVALGKVANDIRWLASGPRAGLGELVLPELQPGSSIMPGKVNPVVLESVLMIIAQVIGHDAAITWGCAGGNFELNTMMPLLAFDLLDSIELLTAGTANLAARCIRGLQVNQRNDAPLIERSLALATLLVPAIGYERAAAIAKEALERGKTIREIAVEQSGLDPERLEALLRYE